jgi:predicted dehydrogenase
MTEPRDPAEEKPIRVGVIGCGQFMSRQHIQTIARNPRLVLQHLAAREEEEVRRVGDRYRAKRCTTRWEDVVADPDVNVLVVGVVPRLHREIAVAAIEHGKPMYVEKPLAETTRQCREIADLARRRGVPVAVGFNRRFAPATDLLHRAFGNAGAPVSVTYRITDDDRVRPPAQNWKRQCRLLIEVVHIFDLLAYLLAAEPVAIYAAESRFNDASVVIEYDNGSRATILSSSYGSLAQPKEHLTAVFDHSAVEMTDFVEFRAYGLPDCPALERFAGRPYDDCDNSHVDAFAERGLEALLAMRERYHRAMQEAGVLTDSSNPESWRRASLLLGNPPLPQINYAPDKGWGRALEVFCLAAAAGSTPPNASAMDGHRATVCAEAARRSIETGQPVTIDRSFDVT